MMHQSSLVGGLVFFGSQLTEILDDVLHVGQEGTNGLVPARIKAERDKLVLELGAFCFSNDSIGELLNEVSMKALRITVGFGVFLVGILAQNDFSSFTCIWRSPCRSYPTAVRQSVR